MSGCGNNDIHFDAVLPRIGAGSARQVLSILAHEAAKKTCVSASFLFWNLWENEHLEPSGIGDSVAVAQLQIAGPQKAIKILATLKHGVDFGACDGLPVDLACLVISPAGDGPLHLRRLSRVSRLLKNDILHKRLLEANDSDAIRSLLIDPEGWLLAA